MANVVLVGKPDGPQKMVPELGKSVGTFVNLPDDNKPCVMWHVPLHMRGEYRPDQLANYDPTRNYRVNDLGYMKCYAKGKNQKRCGRLALNRTSRCSFHGGALHPLDQRKVTNDFVHRSEEELRQQLSRKEQYERGLLTVDEMDDEELAMQGFRDRRGNVIPLKNVPREISQAFVRAVYERANKELRKYTVESVKTLGHLATDTSVDPAIRLRAAQDIIDRNLGKAPQTVSLTVQSPFEDIFDSIGGVSRAESRRLRGKAIEAASDDAVSETNSNGEREIIDVDVVDTSGDSSTDSVNLPNDVSPLEKLANVMCKETSDNGKLDRSRLFARNPAILAQSLELPTKLAYVPDKPTTDDL